MGTRAVREALSTKLNNWASFSEEMHSKGVHFKNYGIKVSWEKVSKSVADILQIEENKEVLKLERLRGLDKGPFVRFISYFHPRIGLTGKEDFSRHLYDILEHDYATVPTVSKERINAITANKEQAKYLKVEEGSPLLLRKRLVCDPGTGPLNIISAIIGLIALHMKLISGVKNEGSYFRYCWNTLFAYLKLT